MSTNIGEGIEGLLTGTVNIEMYLKLLPSDGIGDVFCEAYESTWRVISEELEDEVGNAVEDFLNN